MDTRSIYVVSAAIQLMAANQSTRTLTLEDATEKILAELESLDEHFGEVDKEAGLPGPEDTIQ